MVDWLQNRRSKAIALTGIFVVALGLFFATDAKVIGLVGLSHIFYCAGDLRDGLAMDQRAFGPTPLGPLLTAAAERVPSPAAHELALAQCSGPRSQGARLHIQRALTIAPPSSYAVLQAVFELLPVDPRMTRALVRSEPSDFIAIMADRVAVERAGGDSASDPDIVRGLTRYRLYSDPANAQAWFIRSIQAIPLQHDADVARRHGTKQREIAAYRSAARDIIASAPPHLDPQILAFAQHGTIPPTGPQPIKARSTTS